jgi:hypothetical protein
MSATRPYLRARLTREGWYYLAVLTFIVAGAALCHVNLLVMLGGMMLAPLLINWRMALANLRGVQVRRLPLRSIHAGQTLVVEFEIANPRRWLAAWVLAIEDEWSLADGTSVQRPRSLREWLMQRWRGFSREIRGSAPASALAMCVGPGEKVRAHYELLVPRRGRYRSTSLCWRSTFPLGLVEASVIDRREAGCLVLPRLGRLTAEWTHFISAAISGEGEWQLRERANEGDYFAVRPWQSGDSMRWMHWRTTARTGRPMVRQFERETHSVVALVLDPFLPEQPTAADHARFEAAISFVATALADLAQRDVGQLAVLFAGSGQEIWQGARSALFLEHVMTQLGGVSGQSSDQCRAACTRLQGEVPDASCVLLISSRPAETMPLDLAGVHPISVSGTEFSAIYALE